MKNYKILPKWLVLGFLTALLLISCKNTRHLVVSSEISKENGSYVDLKYVHDTIFVKDSSNVFSRNDTVFAEKWHIKYVSKTVHDTVRAKDTVLVTKIETKEIKAKTPTFKEKFGGFILAMVFGMFICLIIYILNKFRVWK